MRIVENEMEADWRRKYNLTYPWSEWLDGQIRFAEAGIDFSKSTSLKSFYGSVHAAAKQRGLKIRGRIDEEKNGVYFQSYKGFDER